MKSAALVWFILLLAGCATMSASRSFTDAATGFHLEWPATFEPEIQSPVAYLLPTGWRLDLRPGESGRLMAGWVLKGSNDVTTALLRYGISGDSKSFQRCLDAGGGGLPTNQVMIGGRPFTHYQLQDAGMSHYLVADAYRSRYQGRCYAIDLIVHGTEPQVYDPPRTPPFTTAQAQQALHGLLLHVEWLTEETK